MSLKKWHLPRADRCTVGKGLARVVATGAGSSVTGISEQACAFLWQESGVMANVGYSF